MRDILVEYSVKLLLIYVQRLNTNKVVLHRISLMNSIYYTVKSLISIVIPLAVGLLLQRVSSLEFNGE